MTQPPPAETTGQSADGWLSDVAFTIRNREHEQQSAEASLSQLGSAVNLAEFASPAAAEGFSLDPDEAQALLTRALNVHDQLKDVLTTAEALEQTTAPADDPASRGYNGKVAKEAGSLGAFVYGAGHVRLEIEYLLNLIDRLHKAIHGITWSEAQAREDIKKTGESEGGLAG